MNKVSGQAKYAIAYIDNVITHAETFTDHLEHLNMVLLKHKDTSLNLKMSISFENGQLKMSENAGQFCGWHISTESSLIISVK